MHRLAIVALFVAAAVVVAEPIRGTQCTKNQVVNRLTVYEDGGLEAECGPIPCGMSGLRCIEDQTTCHAETDVFSGMRWAPNGQSILLRCCTLKVSNKIYVGTDLVSAGSYYVGGPVAEKDLYGQGGSEYDFIANARTEQGGVRVWVYRIMCPVGGETSVEEPVQEQTPVDDKQAKFEKRRQQLMNRLAGPNARAAAAENNDEGSESVVVDQEQPAFNPLRYRPPTRH